MVCNIKKLKQFGALAGLFLLSACAVSPEPNKMADIQKRVDFDLHYIFSQQEEITGPLRLEDVIARAFKYNLDHQLKLMEKALAHGQLGLVKKEMLPQLMSNAGYTLRNNNPGGVSENLTTGSIGSSNSISQERDILSSGLTFSWDALDFGVSYLRAKQSANDVLIAQERKRKVFNNIITEITEAYWAAVATQRWLAKIDELLITAEQALKTAQKVERKTLSNTLDNLNYQQGILLTIQELKSVRHDLKEKKTILAARMNLRPGLEFTLEDEEMDIPIPTLSETIEELEMQALLNLPELREEDYIAENNRLMARQRLLKLFPSLKLNSSVSYNSNKYLYNDTWLQAGVNLSYNIMNLFSIGSIQETKELQEKVDNLRRQSLSMASLAKLHISLQQFEIKKSDYILSAEIADVNNKIRHHELGMKLASRSTGLAVIRTQLHNLLANIKRDQAYSKMLAAYSRLKISSGEGYKLQGLGHDLTTLSSQIGEMLDKPQEDLAPIKVRQSASR
ncbi:TolC family protein [Temperatibacter marinus]|uniref:TolC family protein n=1 Tax=Temperatibacter marinus TaxID=1456591 RepID=A0AA52EDX7_9PROT|nr:TolC family protein [Temperatibacter marinus]WND02940.1 TolC family protein [Temperatibacter marinus]